MPITLSQREGLNYLSGTDTGMYTCCAMGGDARLPAGERRRVNGVPRQAPSPLLAQMAEVAEPGTEIKLHSIRENAAPPWKRCHAAARFHPGRRRGRFVNPIYGKGIHDRRRSGGGERKKLREPDRRAAG